MSLGKVIQLHQDHIHNVTLMYRPEVTEELELSVSWFRERVTIMLTEGEMTDLAERLTKAVKKMRKHRAKLAKQGRIHTDPVQEYVKHGRRR